MKLQRFVSCLLCPCLAGAILWSCANDTSVESDGGGRADRSDANLADSGVGAADTGTGGTADAGQHPDAGAVDGSADPCVGVTCSGHGQCQVSGSVVTCVCDAGYQPSGLNCVQQPPTNNRPLLGVYIGNDPGPVQQFETWLGGQADGVLAYTGDQSMVGDMDPEWQLSSTRLGGSGRPLLWSIPMTPQPEGVNGMRAAAQGQYETDYQRWAEEILASRTGDSDPIYVRTSWELGGEWFFWTAAATEDPQAYIGAFQHFAQRFHSTSSRFRIVWDFVGDRGPVEQWYPGDDAVDVLSQDVYWNPQWTSDDGAVAFQMMCSDSHWSRGLDWVVNFAAQHGKPMAISEWGATGDNGGPFILAMKQWLMTHDVAYATYWNSNSAYTGQLSYDQFPTTGAVFKQEFGPNSQW